MQRALGSLKSEMLRGVYPERSRRAQHDLRGLRIATQHFKRVDLTGSDDCVRRPRAFLPLGDSSMCVN